MANRGAHIFLAGAAPGFSTALAFVAALLVTATGADAQEPELGVSLICALNGSSEENALPLAERDNAFILIRFDDETRGSVFLLDPPGQGISFARGDEQQEGVWMARGWQTRDGSRPFAISMTLRQNTFLLLSQPMSDLGGSATFGGRCEPWELE